MEQPRVIGHVVSVNGFRLKVELSPEAKSSSRATPDGVQRAVAINSFLTFDLGAGILAIGVLSDLEARESYDPASDEELSLQLTKPRRIASVQLLGTVRQTAKDRWKFDTGITVLPTLDTAAEVANPQILACVFGQPPQRNRPQSWTDGDFDFALEIGHQTGDENTKVKASFNDLFSRPLAIVGNTGSGKSYTVASLLMSVIENAAVSKIIGGDPHIFIFDINGEYSSVFLPEAERKYEREPNEAYVNGKKLAVPIWFMNSEEICEWLSASEQTQQPVLKAWWAQLKSPNTGVPTPQADLLAEALAVLHQMKPLSALKKNDCRGKYLAVEDFLMGSGVNIGALTAAVRPYLSQSGGGDYTNFYGDIVTNGRALGGAIQTVQAAIESRIATLPALSIAVSGDTPGYIQATAVGNTASMITAAASEDSGQISQHLTTLRMRLKTRLADKRWSILMNYEQLGIKHAADWFDSIGFGKNAAKVTVLDLSMLAHEVLPFICATIGRILLEAREKLPANQRFQTPWVIVLEEAHNYARPAWQNEDRGQAQSRKAFERIAKEGRKFGLSLIVASQRPSEISPTIISQCANFFSHRLQNPDDIDHFKRIIPRQAQRLLDQVTVLGSGEAIVFGSAVHVPSRVQIKIPRHEPSSATSAPFADWANPKAFPVDKIMDAWGIPPPQVAILPPSAAVSRPAAREATEAVTLEGKQTGVEDDDIPF
jgi:uncharacterized protein